MLDIFHTFSLIVGVIITFLVFFTVIAALATVLFLQAAYLIRAWRIFRYLNPEAKQIPWNVVISSAWRHFRTLQGRETTWNDHYQFDLFGNVRIVNNEEDTMTPEAFAAWRMRTGY